MAFTLPEALKGAMNPMLAGIMKSIVTTDELGALIPFEPVDGTSIKFMREGTLPTTTFIADAGTTTEESSGADDVVEVQFRRIVGNLDTDLLAEEVGGTSGIQKRNRLIGKKAKTTWRLVKEKLITGGFVSSHTITPAITAVGTGTGTDGLTYGPHLDSSRRGPGSIKLTVNVSGSDADVQFRAPGDVDYGPAVNFTADGTAKVVSWNESFYVNVTIDISDATASAESLVYFASSANEFDGLDAMIDPALLIAPTVGTGDAFSLAKMDELISTQKVRDNRAFIMNSSLIERYYANLRGLGGIHPEHTEVPGYSGLVPTYRGIPLLENDNIPEVDLGGASDTSSIYLVSLNPDEGLVLAAATGGSAFTVDADPRSRPVLGFRIENLGPLEGKDAIRTRVKWYGAPVLKSKLAAARSSGVLIA